MSATPPPSERSTIRRAPRRADYSREQIHAILDEGLVAHVGLCVDGQPYVLPMVYARRGDALYLHGASVSRIATHLASGAPVCVTVTLLDGLVLARSAYNHSANYRSVVVLGAARLVEDEAERIAAMKTLVEHVLTGRWAQVRPPSAQELKATAIVSVSLDESSAKIRMGGPIDEPEDLGLPTWAGVLPLSQVAGAPIAADGLDASLEVPSGLVPYHRARRT